MRRLRAGVLVLAVLLGLSPSPAQADPDPVATKVDAAVRADGGSFFVVLKDRADLSGARAKRLHRDRAGAAYQALKGKADTSQRNVRKLLDDAHASYEPFWIANTVKVTGAPGLLDEIAALPEVERIVPEQTLSVPEPQPGQEIETAAALEWNIERVRADQVWADFGDRGEGIVIGEIDSGVQYDHPALVGSYRGNKGDGQFDHAYNFYDPTGVCATSAPCDNAGHGTHVMGTMVGADGIGVAPGAKWIAAKGCESSRCSESYLLKAGQWILAPTDANGLNPRPDLAPHVVNNSWGGGQGATWYQEIIDAWVAAGIFPAFAAGNDGNGTTCSTTSSPGDNTPAYGVGAFDADNKIATFSGFGPSVRGEAKPNIAAPGVNIRSAWNNGGYRAINGTSMATPHVAASVALVLAAAPSLIGDVAATRRALDTSAVDVGDVRCGGTAARNNIWGEGRLDVYAAVDAAPRGNTAELTGTVTDAATGKPVPGVTVTSEGPSPRIAVTGQDGTYKVRLVSGSYTLTTSSYGYAKATATADLTQNAVRDFALTKLPTKDVSGTIKDVSGKPLAGATITLKDVPLEPTTTDATGAFTFTGVAEGDYDLTAVPPAPILCNGTLTRQITVGQPIDLRLPPRADASGAYSCTPTDYDWITGRTDIGLTGDEDAVTITPPFPITVYGKAYDKLHVTTNGVINLLQPRLGDYANTTIPSPLMPNGAIYAYWDDLLTKRVYTAVDGDRFVVEWRDAEVYGSRDHITFQVVFDRSGGFTLQYRQVGKGEGATVGVEDAGGAYALQYSFDEAALSDRSAIRFTPGTAVLNQDAPAKVAMTEEQIATLDERVSVDGALPVTEPKEEAQAAAVTTTLVKRQLFETARGLAATAELGDGQVVVHSQGTITRLRADGSQVWRRTNASFYQPWNLKPIRPWQTKDYPIQIPMGFSVVGPYSASSDRGFAVGDLNGDGVPEVAFAANVGKNPYRPVVIPGVGYQTGTFVLVLDGVSGDTLWQQVFPDAKHVLIQDGTLIVSDQSSTNTQTPAGYTSTLYGYRFAVQEGKLVPAQTWTLPTGSRTSYWNTLEPAGPGQVAATWSERAARGVPAVSHTMLVGIADGAKKWDVATPGYPRRLRLDGDVLVGLEQNDLLDEVRYDVVTFGLSDGARRVLETRYNALPLQVAVVGKGQYAVSEATIDPYFYVNSSSVRLVGGWSRTVKRAPDNFRDGPMFFALQPSSAGVLATEMTLDKRGTPENRTGSRQVALTLLDAKNGNARWDRRGVVGSPLFSSVGGDEVVTVSEDQNVFRYRLLTGQTLAKTPLLADLSQAAAIDLTGDGVKDLIAGGLSHGVFAFDGAALNGEPKVLWKTGTEGSIHKIELADVDGDGKQEAVVATDTDVLVLDQKGRVRTSLDGHGKYVWTFAVADLDGRAGSEIVVPTDAVRAYSGSGRHLWSWSPEEKVNVSSVAVADRTVYAAYNSPDTYLDPKPVIGAVALGASGKVVWQDRKDPALFQAAHLWNSVFASPQIPDADGHGVTFVWLQRQQWVPNLIEIRDGRTGAVLRTTQNGGLWTHYGWSIIKQGLLQTRAFAFTLIGANGYVNDQNMLPPVFSSAVVRAKSGADVLVMGVKGGIYAYDPAVLMSEQNYPSHLSRVQDLSTANLLATDLDGDGDDEVVGLNFDELGYDRALDLSGGGYSMPDSEVRGLAVYDVE